MNTDSPVLFREHPTSSGQAIGIATLNAPKSLNALSLEMIDLLSQQLAAWETDSRIVAVWLEGAGEKAFCAGGDIVKLYQSMVDHPQGPNPYAQAFFSREYRLDYSIHRYSKPILCWGHGIVMGGGLGLMAGASHRIVTEASRIAMPEISIGLFPDVGGSWFLNRMPEGCGLYLGLTGSSINATDALFVGLGDYFVPFAQKDELLSRLSAANWTTDSNRNQDLATEVLRTLTEQHRDKLPEAQVEPHLPLIQRVTAASTLNETVAAILAADTSDAWISKGVNNLRRGCPVTAHLVWEQLQRGKNWSLGQVFRQELVMVVQCAHHPDFREGVRALLIDKDNQPRWTFSSVEEVPAEYVQEFFTSPWALHEHPLLDL